MSLRSRHLTQLSRPTPRVGLLLTGIALTVASTVLMSSSASFSDTSVNTPSTLTAANVSLSTDRDGQQLLSAGALLEGVPVSAQVTVTHDSDVPALVSIGLHDLQDLPGAAPRVSALTQLRITRPSTGTVVYDGPVDAYPAPIALGTWASGEQRTYRFQLTLDAGTAIVLQDRTAQAAFVWEARS